MTKLCIDCTFCYQTDTPGAPVCREPTQLGEIDLVTGNRPARGCRAVRYHGDCGVEGKLWEPHFREPFPLPPVEPILPMPTPARCR